MFNPQAKLLTHPDRIKEWINSGRTTPILVEISPTGYCNANCPWCSFTGKKSKERINFGVLKRAIEDMAEFGLKAINWSGGGEPSLYPEFKEITSLASDLGLKQGIFTNGYQELPNQMVFSWIRVSITDTGLSRVVKPHVPFGVVLNQTPTLTDEAITNFCLAAHDMGASYFQVRPALTGDFRTQPIIDAPDYLKDFETESFKVIITNYKYDEAQKPKEYNECYGYHFVPSIDWNGKLTVCLYRTLEEEYILGDLNKDYFYDIWYKIPIFAPAVDSCWNCCKNHEINKILYASKYISNKNFL